MNFIFVINFNDMLAENSRASLRACADRWGCGYFEVVSLPEHPAQHAACYKAMAFQLCPLADRLFIIDADTVVRSDCPNPFTEFPDDALTAVFQKRGWGPNDGIERAEWAKCQQFAQNDAERDIVRRGMALDATLPYFNSGVMVASREQHAAPFLRASQITREQGFSWYDQTALNFAARCAGSKIHGAPDSWNCFNPDWARGEWKKMHSFVYHFAGNPARAAKIKEVQWK